MKRINFLFCLLSLSVLLLTSAKCRKDKNYNPVNQLPAETQSGENTFGCLVNGVAFKPQGSNLSGPNLACTYQYIYSESSSGYFFVLNASDKKDPCNITSVGFGIDSILLAEENYTLKNRKNGQGAGGYTVNKCYNPLFEYLTTDIINGILTIKKMDLANQIVSGTFWFNAVNAKGDTVKVSDGRFDVRYTR